VRYPLRRGAAHARHIKVGFFSVASHFAQDARTQILGCGWLMTWASGARARNDSSNRHLVLGDAGSRLPNSSEMKVRANRSTPWTLLGE